MPSAQIVSHNPAAVHPPAGGYTMGPELEKPRRRLFIQGQVPEGATGTAPGECVAAYGQS